MRWLATCFVLWATVALTGCAIFRPDGSWVDGVSERDAMQLTVQIADLAAQQLPPGQTVRLALPPASATGQLVATHLKEALQGRGLTVTEGDAPAKDAHALRYLITRYGEGLLLRVRIDTAEASTVLSRGRDGALIAGAPLAIRKAAQ